MLWLEIHWFSPNSKFFLHHCGKTDSILCFSLLHNLYFRVYDITVKFHGPTLKIVEKVQRRGKYIFSPAKGNFFLKKKSHFLRKRQFSWEKDIFLEKKKTFFSKKGFFQKWQFSQEKIFFLKKAFFVKKKAFCFLMKKGHYFSWKGYFF